MEEIRLHGRGGQGIVMAGEMLVNAILLEGLYGTSIPLFGAERRGAPVAAFVRLDHKPIREKTQIYTPNCLVINDAALMKSVDVFSGFRRGGSVILNTPKSFEQLSLPETVGKVGLINATKIALDVIGAPVTNTSILGAFAATTGWIKLSSVLGGIERVLPRDLIALNKKVAELCYEQTKVYSL
jgi:2-oxoacid:acceptor oxidoreductase gamma subunit (pyruvate/2-ketoisovalerate family)